jgi:anti-anti-sigma factor
MADPRLKVETIYHGRVALVRPAGWVTGVGHAQLEARLKAAAEGEVTCVIADLSAAHFLNLAGLEVFREIRDVLEARGGCLVVATPSWATRRQLFEAGLHHRLNVCETVSEGLAIAREKTLRGRPRPAST